MITMLKSTLHSGPRGSLSWFIYHGNILRVWFWWLHGSEGSDLETGIAQGQKIQADNFSAPVLPGADNKNMPTQSSCVGRSRVTASSHASGYQLHKKSWRINIKNEAKISHK